MKGSVQAEVWDTEARLAHLRLRRQRQARRRRLQRLAVVGMVTLTAATFGLAFVYAGSPGRIADGVSISGVDVGGMTPAAAVRALEQREAAIARQPLVVRVSGREIMVRPAELGVRIDWRDAVRSAQEQVDGFRPLRGLRRLATRAFGAEVDAAARAGPAALDRLFARIGRGDVVHRDAAIRLIGLQAVVTPEKTGLAVDRIDAEQAILGAFAALDRSPITLTRGVDEPRVTAQMLMPVLQRVRIAISKPVALELGRDRITVSKRQIAGLLELPSGGTRALDIGGPRADAYFKALQSDVNRPPRDAEFVPVPGGKVLIRPEQLGRTMDVPRTAEGLLAAALRPVRRQASIVVATKAPDRTTGDAKAMGITGIVSSYTTIYGGDANRVHNVQLVADLIDDTLIAPGQTFSFNGTTGDRNAAKGFLEAPVIINGELQTGLGGGVCQVSTTVFNAAYEAGLKITERTNHALYISHYPQGRDATVNYPDTDLKFVNDTGKWLLLRTYVGSSSLTVNLYGTPQHRRVESEVAPLSTVGKAPTTWRKDPTRFRGERVVYAAGSPARSTSVHRLVYAPSGKLLHDDTWSSYYRGEKKVILVGTKPKPKAEPKQPRDAAPSAKPATDVPAAPTQPTEPAPGL